MPNLLVLIWLPTIAAFVGNILPVFLGALAEVFDLDGRQLGLIAGAELGGTCLASLTAIFWFQRANLRQIATLSLLAGVTGNLITGFAADFVQLAVIRFFTGFFGSGMLYALVLGLIGQRKDPERTIALVVFVQVMSLAAGLSGIPLIMAHWQFQGVTVALALVFASGLPMLRFLSARAAPPLEAASTALSPGSSLAVALLLCLVLYCVGLNGLWAFLERIGAGTGHSMASIGNALALTSLFGAAGAGLAAFVGTRAGYITPLLAAIVSQAFCSLLLATSSDWGSFLVAVYLFNFCWNLALPYILGAIALADSSGRAMVLVPAAEMAGFALGPLLMGIAMTDGNYQLAAYASMIVFMASALLLLWFVRKLPNVDRSKETADEALHTL